MIDDLRAAAGHHEAGRLDQAAALYRRILADHPENADVLHLLGRVAHAQGRTGDAIEHLRRAAVLRPNAALFHSGLADSLRTAARLPEAARHYEQAVWLDADVAPTWLALGETLAELGHIDRALHALRRAIALDPNLIAAHWALAAAGDPQAMPQLQALLARPDLPAGDRINAGFALARMLDQAGRYAEAFRHLDAANALLRAADAAAGHAFDAAELRAFVDRRIAVCSSELFARYRGCGSDSELPVFVVGMPRSGTTLVEQILASHSQIRGVGERHDIAGLVGELNSVSEAEDYAGWNCAEVRDVAEAHVARLAALAPGARRVVDKTPDNLFHLAAIALLFPRARVVVCRRDPRDVCLSCYFQTFAWPAPYANDLAACAQRCQETERLLAHWQSVLPLSLHVVQYEELVADLPGVARQLVEHLGVDWEPGCVDFHLTRRAVQSSSLWQVRRPLYASSVGRWRSYAADLAPLLKVFGRE
ncbi:MAG TPA: sulfotransferase [Acetobacteraceae bacterium]|jgi:tetratricopeptide (TPR) repeat protein